MPILPLLFQVLAFSSVSYLTNNYHFFILLIHISGARQCKYTGQSVRVVPIRILTVGKKRSPGVQLIVDEYIRKLNRYCTVDDVQIRSNPRNASDVSAQVDDEDTAMMSIIRSDDWGASRLSFCIGGPYGHGRQLRERANISIKLSTLVLNHQIALLVLMEQLYRSWTILKGQKYHH
ncbi:putative RNA methyltransferase At5g10620 isoform X7 [Quercus robur]|uniref:putative RNA methyltransferase At5g10620 isoform X7 n=1 Tax=Quercus robur TaxID=38942 RepID=UPI0021632BE1|nr:putative RNA methyltransferase At5g10620 isoform X7 [Quercus robur]